MNRRHATQELRRAPAQGSHDRRPLISPFKIGHVVADACGNGRGGGRPYMNRITGRSAFLALLKDEGITHLFGNPGTTELPIMHALKDHPDLTYVMAMQESLVVAIAIT
jgi:benzoylformate decarboxylase